jgi:hypothetical protein
MYQARISTHDRMSHDFHTFGLDGIALNRVVERHAMELSRNEISAGLRAGHGRKPVRFALGALLMRTGRALAGPAVTAPAPAAAGAESAA